MPSMSHTFVASEDELQLATRLLETNNWNRSDTLSVDVAIGIFKQTGLSFKQLREIWTIADTNATGRLSKEELTVAIRLMGWVQAGKPLEESLMWKLGPLPIINGITDTIVKAVEPSIPPMTCEDVSTFKQTFMESSPIDGLLHKHKVMEIYMRSKPELSFEGLFRIMALVRCNEDGGVDFRNFAIGMHVIGGLNACFITSIPPTIPSEVYQALEIDENSLSATTSTPLSSRHSLPISQASEKNSPRSSTTSQEESNDIQLPEKVESDINVFMRNLERSKSVTGEMALKLLMEYKLPPADLAQIWRQSDLEPDHSVTPIRLTMIKRLVKQKLADTITARPPLMIFLEHSECPTLPPFDPASSMAANPSQTRNHRTPSSKIDTLVHEPSSPDLSALDPPKYKPFLSGVQVSDVFLSQTSLAQVQTTLDEDPLNNFKQELAHLTSHLETIVLGQITAQNALRHTNNVLQGKNDELSLQVQDLQAELARKDSQCEESKELLDAMKRDMLEQKASSKECQEAMVAVTNEADQFRKTVDMKNMQITYLTELINNMGKTISDASPSHNPGLPPKPARQNPKQ